MTRKGFFGMFLGGIGAAVVGPTVSAAPKDNYIRGAKWFEVIENNKDYLLIRDQDGWRMIKHKAGPEHLIPLSRLKR